MTTRLFNYITTMIMLCALLGTTTLAAKTKGKQKWNPRQDKTDIDYLFTTNGTAKLGHQLKSKEELISEYKSRVNKAKAFWPKRTRDEKPVTFTSNYSSVTLSPDGQVKLEVTGKVISGPGAIAWSIYNWTDEVKKNGRRVKEGTRLKLDNLATVGPHEFMLWTSDPEKPFLVHVAMKQKDRYFTFELLHVMNDPETGDLNDDWPGHRVEFDTGVKLDARRRGLLGNWMIHTVPLNPMNELNGRVSSSHGYGSHFQWPYPQWAQTEYRPQPQGIVGIYDFQSDEEHDDVLADMWVAEPTLPRPNRAHLIRWTRTEVDAWLDHWVKVMSRPKRIMDFSPLGKPESLYKIVDIMAESDMNRIALHNFNWQGLTPGAPNKDNFPSGVEDAIKFREYCHARGVDMHFHGFGALIRTEDPKYGRRALDDAEGEDLEFLLEGLGKTARGTLLHDIPKSDPKSEEYIRALIKPDLDYYPGMKAGMKPYIYPPPWGNKNSGYGNTFPPYMEKTPSAVVIGNKVYGYRDSATDYRVKVTEDGNWECLLEPFRCKPEGHKAGETVYFILMHSGWTCMDSRSEMVEQVARDYATILNHFQSNDLYDGAGMTEDLGSWGIRKMTQMVFEQLDHPVGGTQHFGHFFKRFKRANPAEYKGTRMGTMPVTTWGTAVRTSSVDHSIHGINISIGSKDMSIRGNHAGIELDLPEKHGAWKEVTKAFHRWSELKPHLSLETKEMIAASSMENLFLASETDDQWRVTKARAMRREGVDAGWQRIPERPQTAPRQAIKANSDGLSGLNNPFVSQVPEVQLHVGAGMTTGHKENLSLMPNRKSDVIFPGGATQTTKFEDGKFTLSVDNSTSPEDYHYIYRGRAGEHNMHWLGESLGFPEKFALSEKRGMSITVNGDGSGAILVFSLTHGWPRSYGVVIDFVGERTFEVPTGEYINSRAYWDVHDGCVITASNYSAHQMSLYLYRVPAGKTATVEVLDIQAMFEDRDTGLIDPVLQLNDSTATVTGTIPYNHYLVYSEGASARVYGPNWHFVKEVPVVVKGKFEAQSGNNDFSVSAPKSPNTWLSSRIKVEDTANIITIAKPAGFDSD